MATYKFTGLGLVSVLRNGQDGGPDRYKWNVRGNDENGVPFRTWITTPSNWSEDDVVSTALDAVSHEIVKFTGDDTGNMWDVYSHDMHHGKEHAASYRVNGVSHYRTQPFTLDPDSQTFPTLEALERWIRDWFGCSLSLDTDVFDVYRNNDDEPTFRYIVGPRGGLRRENY